MLISVLRGIARAGLRRSARTNDVPLCPVCSGKSRDLGEVDFNKSCEDRHGTLLPKANRNVRYCLCDTCEFCFAPEFKQWSDRDFMERIYNDDYVKVDPEYVAVRPRKAADYLEHHFGSVRNRITHLDYGGGNGLMSRLLCAAGWNSTSYDEFVDDPSRRRALSTYDLVTAFEVFEHVADPQRLMVELSRFTHPQSVIVFTTLLADGHVTRDGGLDWWYLAPRNGHISLFSSNSLHLLLRMHGYTLVGLDDGTHMAYRELPAWGKDVSVLRSA